MCKHARLDHPGCLHHVTAHAIDWIDLFMDDLDRESFVRTMERVFADSGVRCLAWALMTNHVHLLIETGHVRLSVVMQRLLQMHAQSFNRRHGHRGHVLGKRFSSKIVDGDSYLLLAVRYVHRNPLSAGIVSTIDELETYPWTGHAALMGRRPNAFQDVESVLSMLGSDERSARCALLEFVGSELGSTMQPLPGSTHLDFPRRAQAEACVFGVRALNARTSYISETIRALDTRDARRATLQLAGWDIDRVLDDVCRRIDAEREAVVRGSKTRIARAARDVVAFVACEYLGMKQTAAARRLGVGQTSISRALERGRDQGMEWFGANR
jgi:putative transposase